jgi:hypothetical protein
MAHGPTLDSSGGVATSPTLPGGAPGGGAAGTPGSAPVSAGSGGTLGGSLPGSAPKPPTGRGPAPVQAYGETAIASAYKRNPALVHRAINYAWYESVLTWQNYQGDDYPPGIKVGDAVVVAPDYDGPGPPRRTTPIEEPEDEGKLGPNDPVPGDPRLANGPRQQKPDLSDPQAKRAHFPGSRRGAEPGMKAAVPLTHDEVMRAYRENPASVHPSDSDEWHDQVFALDRGTGKAPRAFRSGNTIIVDPSYPLDGRPLDSSPRGTVKQPGTGSDLGTVLNPRRKQSPPAEAPHQGPATATHAGPAPDPASAVELPGGPTTTTKSKREFKKNPLGAFKAKDASLGGHHSATTTTTVHGQDEHGENITSSTENKSNLDVNFKGLEGGKDITHTTKGGAQVGAGVHGSMDWDGNTNLVASATFKSRSGLSISPSVGHSDQADASDPQYIEGTGFVVAYKLSATDNYGVGGGKSIGGGTSASVNVGHSEANYQSGSRIFKTLDEANSFRDNVRRDTWQSRFMPPPTSVEGALLIPKGESRGGGKASADTIGGSMSYGGGMGDIGVNHVSTSNKEVSVMRVGKTTVDVTRTYSDDTTVDPHIGAFGASNTKGKSEESGRAITYTFDLATSNGASAFQRWVSSPGDPGAGATHRRVKHFTQSNRHDDYGMPVKFSASWKDRKWESKEEDDEGNVTETFGGGQDFDTRTGAVAEFLGDKEQHANAQIEATIRNGQESFSGRFAVSGKSGDANLEQLGKIFMGSHHDAGESSGFLLLSVQIDPLVVQELMRNSKAFRNAKTEQDRMRIYTDYIQENGARMIGGQGRGGSKPLPWNLERPGDPNFPGAGGRAELDAKHQAARDQLASDHKSGAAVADSAKQEIAKLKERRKAVADKKKYTDLPDELRQEQVDLVDDHIAKFAGVQSQSLSLAMRVDPDEKAPDKLAKAKVARKQKAKAPPPSADQLAADAKQTPDQREIKKVSKAIEAKEQAISTFAMRTQVANQVLGRMMQGGNVRVGEGVKFSVHNKYNTEAKGHLAQARVHEEALKASAQRARELRIKWSEAQGDGAKLAVLRDLDKEMAEQKTRAELALDEIQQATRWAYVVTSDKGIGDDQAYFRAIKCDFAERSLAINTANGDVPESELL